MTELKYAAWCKLGFDKLSWSGVCFLVCSFDLLPLKHSLTAVREDSGSAVNPAVGSDVSRSGSACRLKEYKPSPALEPGN